MKKNKLKSILFSLLILISFCTLFVLAQPVELDHITSQASCTKGASIEKDTEKSNEFLYTGEDGGNIPFSLFLSTKDNAKYEITNYMPTFTSEITNESNESIYHYVMEESSRPYFLLSSSKEHDTELYNTSVVFKFNDSDGKVAGANTIPNSAGFVNIDAKVNGTTIAVERDSSNATTDDTSVVFSVNLQALTDPDNTARCPMINAVDYLGGNGIDNETSFRTGLYEFKIEYSYKDNVANVSNKCVFTISFYILDYRDYIDVDATSPFVFENTDTFFIDTKDTNYELFNYNYEKTPIVKIDATKFGFSFTYTSGYTNHIFRYKNFIYDYTPDRILNNNYPDGTKTGSVVVGLKDSEKTYTINTYKQGTNYYVAKFDVTDFAEKFIIPNKLNTTFQGTYSFDLDFLIQNATTYTVVDKLLFDNIPEKISNQKMVLFGYELKYYDQNPNSSTYLQDVTLKNDVTHTNFISYNSATVGNSIGNDTGYMIDIPDYIAITDQAPLRFHSFGNLMPNYSSSFLMYDYKTTSEQEILDKFNDIIDETSDPNTKTNLANSIDAEIISNSRTYLQGSSISGDGIRIMKLDYQLSIPVAIGENSNIEYRTISGFQYVVFEVNNTVQNLYIQAVEDDLAYDFDYFTNKDVRVNLEEKPNTFFAPVQVTFAYSSTFKRDEISSTGTLTLKKDNQNNFEYTINNKNYVYYVTAQANNFTFNTSGYYKVTIRSVISNVPKTHSFVIDKTDFTNVVLNKAVLNGTNYVKSATTLSSSLLNSSSSEYLKYDLFVSNCAFTLSWKEKPSGASSSSFVYYMETTEDTSYAESSLFKTLNNEYWLTNGLKFSTLSSAIDNYQNSVHIKSDGSSGQFLQPTNYFNKDGIYYFYVFDEAGNFFTRIVLIDTSLSTSLQGKWDGSEENSNWINTFDPVKNPANYVNEDTTIYFGSHKALRMPDMSEDIKIEFEDTSFTRAYDLSDNGKLKTTKPPISFMFYADVLNNLTNYIKNTTFESLIGSAPTGSYLTLKNTLLEYRKEPTAVDLETEQVLEPVTTGVVTEIYKAKIFTKNDGSGKSKYNFYDEAYYDFTITNINGKQMLKQICMNFDMVQGTFYAYGNDEGDNDEHLIRKNSATNLNVLKFEYNKLVDETAEFYTLKSLTYDFYEFVLDDSNSNSSATAYPFAKTASKKGEDLLAGQVLDEDRSIYMIDPINISPSNESVAGKYILTRTYKGGTHNYIGGDENDPTSYEYVGEGGSYYKNEDDKFINLFELDSLVRKYIVYVDHNGIITSTYMIREDGQENIREVGDKISITLSNALDEEWNFKEFFLTSSGTLSLDTNKVPVKINIPLSKYFAYYNAVNDNLYSKLNFAKLQISIFYARSIYSEWIEYKIDGYDNTTGLCTCSKLVSQANPNGYLIFNAEGTYRIEIKDGTGYSDVTVNTTDANNLFPTTYIYTFEISHTAPYSNMYTSTYNYQKDKFETTLITNEDASNNFATNIKKANDNGKDNNQVYATWSDPITPYNAKVNQIDIEVLDNKTKTTISIDLKKINFFAVASSAEQLVDLSSIANSSFIIYFKVAFFEDDETPAVYDNQNYYRYTYTISVDITKEYVYSLTLSYVSDSTQNQTYVDNNGKSYADTLYTLTIDRTKPFTNIDSLLKSEDFLQQYYTSSNINDFKEEKFNVANLENTPSAFSYTFGVSNSYRLTYNNADTASYFYVRNYNNYEDQYISITPDMVDTVYEQNKAYYTDFSAFSINYPRFTEVGLSNNIISVGAYNWYKIDYSANESLYNLIARAINDTTPTGFFEIIEKDLAGNFRCYTVYFTEYTPATNYLLLFIDGYNEQGYSKVDNDSDNNITAKLMFELTELETKFGWGKLSIKNETMDAVYPQTINFTPFDSFNTIEDRIASLNEFFQCDFDSRFSITLSKYNASYPSITRYINIITNESTAKLAAPVIEEVVNVSTGTVSYNLKFPAYTSKSVLYLESLKLNVLQGNVWQNLYNITGKNNVPEKITNLNKGIYQAVYQDNYNKENSYSYIIYVGEYYINDFNTEYNFEYSTYQYDTENNIYYSGGKINVTYEANIYSVWVNGEIISGNSLRESLSDKLGNYNCKTFELLPNYNYKDIPANERVGGETYYEVVYRDITDNSIQKTFTFIIYNALPEITLTNAYGGDVTSTLEESSSQITSSIVYIDWGEIKNCDFDELNDSDTNFVSTGILYTKNQNGEYKNGVIISRGQNITEEGYYKLQLKNSKLGNYREIYFVIQFGDFPLYTVTVNDDVINPSSLETFDLTSTSENHLAKSSLDATPTTIIDVIYSAMTQLNLSGELNTSDYQSLKSQLGYKGGYFDATTVGIASLNNIPHYYTIENAEIVYNSNIELNIVEFCFNNNTLQEAYKMTSDSDNPTPSNVGGNYWTTIYLVYNLDGPIRIEFFAVTKVPKTSSLLIEDFSFENEFSNSTVSVILSKNTTKYTLTNKEIKESDITLIWRKLNTATTTWYNQGNNVYISDKYGVETEYTALDCFAHSVKDNKEYISTTITGSGTHNLLFKDLAGNTHQFASNTYAPQDFYTIYLIDSVIYHINYQDKDYNPIQYGVFNNKLSLQIDQEYILNYSNLNMVVTRNGNLYNGYTKEDDYRYLFTESGRYTVQITALYGSEKSSLNPVMYNFTIINSNSARLAYEFIEISGYEILKVIRNNEDITDNFRNADGKVLSLFISSSSSLSGNGLYTITMKYGKKATDTLTYSFSINNYVPTLSCNVAPGETTTGSIVVSYNPSTIYEQLGECYIKVLTYNTDSKTFYNYTTITIDENSFVNTNAKSFEITRSNSYFIQVQTKNGNTVSSFRVNKKDPLNAVAIIIIVVAVIAVVILIIVVVKLRTKMKIK